MSASEHRIYFLLQRVAHRLKTEADASLASACGLTTAQAATLTVIAQSGPTNQQQVARTLSQRESAITTMARRLLDAGYITKEPSSTDARAWELDVTEAGRAALREAGTAFSHINDVIDECFTAEQIESIASGFGDVLTHLERTEVQPEPPTASLLEESGES